MARAKIIITCEECGKQFVHTHICQNREAAANYEEWARSNITVCPKCYGEQLRAEERAKIDEQTEHAVQTIKECGVDLPALTGTEKQIAWAMDIRARGAKMFIDAGAKGKAWDIFNSKTEAKWWIENRNYCDTEKSSARMLIKAIMNGGV